MTGALEVERREKRIGSSLEAAPQVFVGEDDARLLATVDLAELAITSGIEVVAGAPPAGAFTLDDTPGVGVVPKLAEGTKCARCWQMLRRGRCRRPVRALRRCGRRPGRLIDAPGAMPGLTVPDLALPVLA